MALRVNPISAQLSKLSLGISRTSLRFSHSKKKTKETVTLTAKEKAEQKQRQVEAAAFPPHHGEKIWIFHHFAEGMTVLSHTPIVKANKALRQIPFNGKKLKPSTFRKDYWRPLAMIQFPEGYGEVGRSVYQRLRECKKLQELSWGDDMLYDDEGKPLTKHERGKRLNDMRAKTIADMAAVLKGLGKGSKIWMPVPENAEDLDLANVVLEGKTDVNQTAEGKGATNTKGALVKAEIWWADDQDKNYAKRWSPNVSHYRFDQAGLEEMSVGIETEGEAGSESHLAPETLVAAEQSAEQSPKGADQRASP
ncbi:transcriptional regulation of mitochondrial recombination-domain-containing protein [Hypomontagnella monticulosa]|nr:transcriptional regulation of mitochondrial recombination-domain-containing protein [Hypomontagnella monticulosa]